VSKYKHIFTPLNIGKITVKNRIEIAPAMPFLATSDCDASQELVEWEKALAKGGAGIVTVGDSPVVSAISTKVGHILNLGIDKSIHAINRLAEAIQRYGAKASIELTYLDFDSTSTPSNMTLEEINNLRESFVKAAYRCLNAKMDMIMIHGAHGHLISQFLSPRKNSRTDAYGGSFANRARFVVEMLEEIRNKVGDRLAIEYRISADELMPGGLTLEEQLDFARVIQDKVDLMHISAGNLFEPECSSTMIQPTYVPRGMNVHFAERFKKELKIPVTALGSLDLDLAEQIIAEGKADMVAMNRAFIADHDCLEKARKGKEDTIRPCVRCNTCIQRTHMFFLPIRCAVNPLAGREAEFVNLPPSTRKKKVVVIGGGPAGMEAARRAAERGHDVVLFEKNARLGGALTMASAMLFKADMKNYLDWSIRMTMNTTHLTVKLSTEATPQKIKAEKPDALIIAVGSTPIIPQIPGIDRKNIVWAGDVALDKATVGNTVVVVGAGLTGSETALYLAQQGKKVTLIDMLPLEQIDVIPPHLNIMTLRTMLNRLNVATKPEVKLEAISDIGVVIVDKNNKRTEIPCNTIVLSLGLEPRKKVVKMFENLASDVYVIGDCNNQRGNLFSATSEGFLAAMDI
jgi:2,4-dienoyl-CoA reductase-like NADH-dependent reductase (Old Yellow Enzyme family)/thioredoxin reductase